MRRFSMFVGLVLGLSLVAGPPADAAPQQVTLLHVNDTHSHLAAWGPKDASLDGTLGGLPKAAAIVAAERLSDPQALFVHAGDVMNGDLFFNEYLGVPELQLLKSIGLDALILGNRDFQFGPNLLTGVFAAAWPTGGGVPILGTNLQIPAGHALGAWVTPTLIKDVNGVKVGFLGLTHPKGALAKPKPVVILDPAAVAPAGVTALRAAGAKIVVCVTHFGMDRARQLAQAVPGIDVIVNAHDNAVLEQPEAIARPGGGTTLIVSAGNYYRFVGRLRLSVDGDQVSFVDYALISADADTPALSAVQEAIDELKVGIVARYGDVYHQALAWADQDIVGESDPSKAKRDTPLGNLFTDAYRARTGTDIAIEASGYLGEALPEGPIVGADVFRSMSYGSLAVDPFGQQIVRPWRLTTFRATGAALIGVLEILLDKGGDYFPQISGLRMDYDSRLSALHRILLDTVHVNGHRFVANQLYSVTATEGVYSALLTLGLVVEDPETLPDLAFDAARDLVERRGDLGPAASNRIRDIAAIPGRSGLQAAETLVGPTAAARTRAPIAESTNPPEVRREPAIEPVKSAAATAGTVRKEAGSRPPGTEVRRQQ